MGIKISHIMLLCNNYRGHNNYRGNHNNYRGNHNYRGHNNYSCYKCYNNNSLTWSRQNCWPFPIGLTITIERRCSRCFEISAIQCYMPSNVRSTVISTFSAICSGVMMTPTPQNVSKAFKSTGSTGLDFKNSKAAVNKNNSNNIAKLEFYVL